jgi:YVTN family beta-propeller protein
MIARYAGLVLLPVALTGIVRLTAMNQGSQERVYVGELVCRECHLDQFNVWRLTKHQKAYAVLSMPESKQIAKLSGVSVDPQDSPICLGCHTTAYNSEEWERDETFRFEDGVQCERCHGPGSEYMDAEVMGRREKAVSAGLNLPDESTCLVCHKEKGSHTAVLDVRPFVFDSAVRGIAHPGRGEPPAASEGTPPAGALAGPRYVGALACGTCHKMASGNPAYEKWRASPHAQAYAVLGTDRASAIAGEAGVGGNPQDASPCLACHTTGAGEPQGRFAETFDVAQGVQCESCHGPGSDYMAEAIMRDPVAAAAAGLADVERSVCGSCHIEGGHGQEFDISTAWPEVDHSKWQEDNTTVEYKTPWNLAVTQNGRRLFVAAEASNSLIVVDVRSGAVLAEVAVGVQPHFVTLSPDDSRAYVSNRGSDNISVIDAQTLEVLSVIGVGDEPHEMVTTVDGTVLYVANAGTSDVSVVDVTAGRELKRLAASRGPWGVARSPDGRHVYVTNNLPRHGVFREPTSSEVTVVETNRSTVTRRLSVPGANLVQGVAVAPSGDFALVTLIRTKNLVPMTRNAQGWIMTNGIGVLWEDGRVDQLLLDQVNDFFADPTDVVFSRDGRYVFVTGGGVQEVAMIDVEKMIALLERATPDERKNVLPDHLGTSLEFTVTRIPVGRSPRGMAVSPDNRYLYVADGLDDAVSVIDIAARERVRVIDLGGPSTITEARHGERIFHSAAPTFARQFSCHSCHPDGGVDGITYDIEPDGLGINPVDNRTLRGIYDTAPFKWAGTNITLRRQCGPRLAAFFTRSDPFTNEEASALERYIVTIARPPNRHVNGDALTAAQRRGKQIFERRHDKSGNPLEPTERCAFCHAAPYFTNRNIYDVGTASWLDTKTRFDVPHLNNIYASAPYLHDGRAKSLEEIWTVYNPHDTHGRTNDLTKDQLNDLIEYIKTF